MVYQVGLIDRTNTGDASGAMTVHMTKAQYDKQIKGKKQVKGDAKKTVYLLLCKKEDQERLNNMAFEFQDVKTSLETTDANKDWSVKDAAAFFVEKVNGSEAEKQKYLSEYVIGSDSAEYWKEQYAVFKPVESK